MHFFSEVYHYAETVSPVLFLGSSSASTDISHAVYFLRWPYSGNHWQKTLVTVAFVLPDLKVKILSPHPTGVKVFVTQRIYLHSQGENYCWVPRRRQTRQLSQIKILTDQEQLLKSLLLIDRFMMNHWWIRSAMLFKNHCFFALKSIDNVN